MLARWWGPAANGRPSKPGLKGRGALNAHSSMTLRLLLLTSLLRVGHLAVRLLRVRLHGPVVEADKKGDGAGRRRIEDAGGPTSWCLLLDSLALMEGEG